MQNINLNTRNLILGYYQYIREISGYSKDLSILKNFGSDFILSDEEVRCLIIYPQNAFTDLAMNKNDNNMLQELQDMDSMNEFLSTI